MTRLPTKKIRSITTARMTRLYFVLAVALGAQFHAAGEEPSVGDGDLAGTLDDQARYFAGEAEDLGHDVRLFLDPSAYADRWDVVARVNEPAKHPDNPVVIPDQPWEHSIGLPSVLYDEQDEIFRMWYANYDIGKWGGGSSLEKYKHG